VYEDKKQFVQLFGDYNILSKPINILTVGDSHSNIFKICDKQTNKINFKSIVVDGASAQGSVNPRSKTNFLETFKQEKSKINLNFDHIIIMIGEVDCGFVIWYRSEKYNISVDKQLINSVDKLFEFIKNEFSLFHPEQIIVVGSILPTILDNTDKNILRGERKLVKASQIERTTLTLEYNTELKNRCKKLGYNYEDITSLIINKKTNLVNDYFLNDDRSDHHLSSIKTYRLWLDTLTKYVSS
jgi:protein associated with RNAse G/E